MADPAPPIRDYLQAKRWAIEQAGDDLEELQRVERQVDGYLRGFRPVYELRDELRGRIAGLQGPAVLPRASRRTAKQDKIAHCPRCAGEITPVA